MIQKSFLLALICILSSTVDAQNFIPASYSTLSYPGGKAWDIEIKNFNPNKILKIEAICDSSGFEVKLYAQGGQVKELPSPQKYFQDKLRHAVITVEPYLGTRSINVQVYVKADSYWETTNCPNRNTNMEVPVRVYCDSGFVVSKPQTWRKSEVSFMQVYNPFLEGSAWFHSIMLPYEVDGVSYPERLHNITEEVIWTPRQKILFDSLFSTCDQLYGLIEGKDKVSQSSVTFGYMSGIYCTQVNIPNPTSWRIAEWKKYNVFDQSVTTSVANSYVKILSLQKRGTELEQQLLCEIADDGIKTRLTHCNAGDVFVYYFPAKTLRKWQYGIKKQQKKLSKEDYLK